MIKSVFKGDIIHTPTKGEFEIYEDSYLIIENCKVVKISHQLEDLYKNYDFYDFSGKIIIPGFVDVHLHAPQYPNRGLGMDKELIPWLNTYTFPEESKYKDIEYSRRVFKEFINDIWKEGTTRSAVYSTIFLNSTKLLMDMFIESGLGAYIGKVNMDRNSAPNLTEDTYESIKDTKELILEYKDRSELVRPIITPRFIPTCTDELLTELGNLAIEYNIPVQSHLNENTSEVEWVKELYPNSKNYASVYDDFSLFGQSKTIMAHCVHNTDEEIDLMADNGVYAAHCPYSNFNLSSGMSPIREYLNAGVNVGLGSDISGGHILSIPRVMVGAIHTSKMVWLQNQKELAPLTLSEAFYLATKGGGSFFGKVGSFEKGYDSDLLVIDIDNLTTLKTLTPEEKLQKFIYEGSSDNIIERYVKGKKIERPYK
ncbi:guanine deaminase [Tissierella sp. Yu-01]|uniref:guanine deaminase n=1 Tax=Tissierella sp. Yu-01 TaxID=3035694 RepID=UPI00240E13F1|nr:guanine deaminase [Tissierella sp. Yu-01]WFA07849.1 guanine deaminase [Tissierella sp. Yu-01]